MTFENYFIINNLCDKIKKKMMQKYKIDQSKMVHSSILTNVPIKLHLSFKYFILSLRN